MKKWPADRVERKPVDALVPYAKNARTHSEEQVAQIAASIERYGFTVPVLMAEDGGIIAGHGRVMAAKRLGLTDVPAMTAEGWSDAERQAYRLVDNKLGLNAGWDEALLRTEFAELEGLGFDLGQLGFSPPELASIRDTLATGLTDPDEAPPAPVEPVATRGDLWALGRHRLLCGDATSAEDVQKVAGEASPQLMVTDPPYGVEYDPDWRIRSGLAARVAAGKVNNDDRKDWREAWKLFAGKVAYVWHADRHCAFVAASLEASGFKLRAQIVWVKTRPVIGRGDYHWQHEPVLYTAQDGADDGWQFMPAHELAAYSVLNGANAGWQGGHRQSTVWFIEHVKSETGHSAQKPVECMKRPIENNSKPSDAVYDPFVGSGTTIIAAEMTARQCCAIEINPVYVDVAIMRWQNFTGAKAKLGGKTFEQIAKQRKKKAA
jgi:DNA modification methylase